jgi:hypothetical protein
LTTMYNRPQLPNSAGKPLPLMLTADAAKHETFFRMRENLRNYQNKALHGLLGGSVRMCRSMLFTMQLVLASLPSGYR